MRSSHTFERVWLEIRIRPEIAEFLHFWPYSRFSYKILDIISFKLFIPNSITISQAIAKFLHFGPIFQNYSRTSQKIFKRIRISQKHHDQSSNSRVPQFLAHIPELPKVETITVALEMADRMTCANFTSLLCIVWGEIQF